MTRDEAEMMLDYSLGYRIKDVAEIDGNFIFTLERITGGFKNYAIVRKDGGVVLQNTMQDVLQEFA